MRSRLVVSAPASLSRAALTLAIAVLAPSCATPPVPVNSPRLEGERVLRYTLRTQPETLYSVAYRSNYLGFTVSPQYKVGSPVKVKLYSVGEVHLDFNGIEVRMFPNAQPFPTDDAQLQQFLDKHFASSAAELNLDALAPNVRAQIEQGTAAIGMTKEQVFMALGYPLFIDQFIPTHDLPRDRIFQSSTWIYSYSKIMFWDTWYYYKFDNDGILVQRIPQ